MLSLRNVNDAITVDYAVVVVVVIVVVVGEIVVVVPSPVNYHNLEDYYNFPVFSIFPFFPFTNAQLTTSCTGENNNAVLFFTKNVDRNFPAFLSFISKSFPVISIILLL